MTRHPLAENISAYTWQEDDGWYSYITSDQPGDPGTDAEGPFPTESEALAAARALHAERQQDETDLAEEARYHTESLKVFHVWGRGPAQDPLIRDAEYTEAAARTALHHGFDPGADSDCWAVEVRASEAEIDAATRHDAAVVGYAIKGGI